MEWKIVWNSEYTQLQLTGVTKLNYLLNLYLTMEALKGCTALSTLELGSNVLQPVQLLLSQSSRYFDIVVLTSVHQNERT